MKTALPSGSAMKRLLDERNPALAERIDALHAGRQAVFAAVGSLHMVGPNGLPGAPQAPRLQGRAGQLRALRPGRRTAARQ